MVMSWIVDAARESGHNLAVEIGNLGVLFLEKQLQSLDNGSPLPIAIKNHRGDLEELLRDEGFFEDKDVAVP